MRLSTSTNIMDRYQKVQGAVSMECCLSSCAAAGYEFSRYVKSRYADVA